MILASALILLSIFPIPLGSRWHSAAGQTAQQPETTESSGTQSTTHRSEPAPQKPADVSPPTAVSPQQKASAQKPGTTKKRVHKKKVSASGCETAASSSANDPTTPTSAGATPENSAAQLPGNSPATKDCPPEKIIVRQGGTSDASIQLAGGDQASQKRDAANQLLGSTEANLKKISGIQLSTSQRDVVSQIRQFVNQSKEALAAGDLERGHTLAWKAQILSEDLVNPQK